MPDEQLLLGIDIGTQGVKAVLVDLDGCVVSRAALERGPSHPRPGWVEMDPEEDLWAPVLQVVKQLFSASGASPKSIQVVGISGLVPCLCPIDEAGDPVGAMILYSDNRAIEELDWVNRMTGLSLSAEAVIPKLVWIRDHEPERYQRIRTVFSAHNYVVYRLTGQRCIDYDTAGILGGIFQVDQKCWAADVCQRLDLPAGLFPQPRPATAIAGKITPQAALQSGLPVGVPVIAGSGDTFPTMIGCGIVHPGDAMVSFGTTGLLTLTQKPLENSAAGPHFDDGSGAASVAWVANVLSAARLVRWFGEQFGPPQNTRSTPPERSLYELWDGEAGQIPPGAEGLIVLPHWLGRRTPTPNALLRGAMVGFTPSHTSAHIYRAILESFAYNLRQSYIPLRAQIHRLVATAGGARSSLWRQIVADGLNTPLEYYPDASGALGIAFLAGYAVGLIAHFDRIRDAWLRRAEQTLPEPEAATRYDRYYEVYCEFEAQMTAPFDHLAQVIKQEARTLRRLDVGQSSERNT